MAGAQLLAAEKEDLAELIEHCTVFAKVTPQQKMSIVAGLQSKGHIVGFLGDGNNDALALRKADVGVSVDSGKVYLHACNFIFSFAQILQSDAHSTSVHHLEYVSNGAGSSLTLIPA